MVMIVFGVLLLMVVAIFVGIVDAAKAPAWRQVAADRRRQWEIRQPEFHGIDASDTEAWDEE